MSSFHQNIVVVGAGHVGFPLACLLAGVANVTVVDVNESVVDAINQGEAPRSGEPQNGIGVGSLPSISATTDIIEACKHADFAVIAVPTDYSSSSGTFNTDQVLHSVDSITRANNSIKIVVKSTVPIGFTSSLAARYPDTSIVFCPEFLRENQAFYDSLHPSRIILGLPDYRNETRLAAQEFANLVVKACGTAEFPVLFMTSGEAESVKLFSNAYLAMRIAFFNELDTFAASWEMNSRDIITGVCCDPRIGDFYNNPSFGYGGYCLPKDTKQLLSNYSRIPQELVAAIVRSNETRKVFIADEIQAEASKRSIGDEPALVGFFGLAMKSGSDNYRSSSVIDVLSLLQSRGVDVAVFDKDAPASILRGYPSYDSLDEFKEACSLIVANRWDDRLEDVAEKIFTRDLFFRD